MRIRALTGIFEHYLEESGVREAVGLHFDGGPAMVGQEHELREALNTIEEAPAQDISEFIMWEKLATQDRWRLVYLKNRREGYWFEGDYVFQRDPGVLDHRPLIETPGEIRLRASEVLPDLVEAVADKVKGPHTRLREFHQVFSKALKAISKEKGRRKKRTSNPHVQ